MTRCYLLLVVAALTILIAPVNADTFTFYASGTSTTDTTPRNQAGTAQFVISGSTLTVTLTNTLTEQILGVSQTLVGVEWTYGSSSPTNLRAGTAPWVVASGILDCSSGTCLTGSGTSPFDWGLNASPGPSGATVTTPNLFAGAGSGHAYGIVTSNINGSSDGLSNAPHNPYLVGPVTFTLTYDSWSGTPTISGATLFFGTAGDSHPGTVPDGGLTLIMLGGALVGIESLRRRFRA